VGLLARPHLVVLAISLLWAAGSGSTEVSIVFLATVFQLAGSRHTARLATRRLKRPAIAALEKQEELILTGVSVASRVFLGLYLAWLLYYRGNPFRESSRNNGIRPARPLNGLYDDRSFK